MTGPPIQDFKVVHAAP